MSDENTELSPSQLQELRDAASTSRANATKAAEQEREIAFLRAGIDTDTTFGKSLMQNFDGELTKEAITEAAKAFRTELGIPEPGEKKEEPPPGAPGTPEAQHQQTLETLAGQGTTAGAPPPPAPKTSEEQAREWYEQARKSGLSEVEAQEAAIGSLIRSAQDDGGDNRFDKKAWAAEQAMHGHGAEFASLPDG